jgi:hypothetical protein
MPPGGDVQWVELRAKMPKKWPNWHKKCQNYPELSRLIKKMPKNGTLL